MNTRNDSVVVINIFTPRPGALNDFLAAHRARMLPLLEKAEPGRYRLVFQAGEV